VQRAAVTGADGLIGAAVCARLSAMGVAVAGIDLSRGHDVAGEGIVEVLDGARPEVVIHAAAHPGGASLSHPVEDVRVNALGSMRVFEWCASTGVPVVYLSSSIVYGDQPPGPISETATLQAGTVYGTAKLACEQWLRILGEGRGLQWTVLRLFATYGAGHRPSAVQGIVNVMLTQLLQGDRVVVRGSLARRRDLIYVDDVASAIAAAATSPFARGHVLNVGTGTSITIRELIELLARILGKAQDQIAIEEAPGTVGDPLSNIADISRARAILGFEPQWTIEAGLRALVADRQARA
jgi:nucleoside-diphosphate-sugar epimerase